MPVEIRMPGSWMRRCVAPVRMNVSEEFIALITGVTRIGELGTTLTVNSNRLKINLYGLD
jgi:hypothetical protein